MAALTLIEKSNLLTNPNFQKRLISALKEHARYWLSIVINNYDKYNEELRKKKGIRQASN